MQKKKQAYLSKHTIAGEITIDQRHIGHSIGQHTSARCRWLRVEMCVAEIVDECAAFQSSSATSQSNASSLFGESVKTNSIDNVL
jgi:hypothetical protein